MTQANAIDVQEGNGILGQYAQYMSDLSALMVRIHSLVGQEGDKPKLHTWDRPHALEKFRKQYSGEEGIIKPFSKRADTEELMKPFHSAAVLIQEQKQWSSSKQHLQCQVQRACHRLIYHSRALR